MFFLGDTKYLLSWDYSYLALVIEPEYSAGDHKKMKTVKSSPLILNVLSVISKHTMVRVSAYIW